MFESLKAAARDAGQLAQAGGLDSLQDRDDWNSPSRPSPAPPPPRATPAAGDSGLTAVFGSLQTRMHEAGKEARKIALSTDSVAEKAQQLPHLP